MGQSTRDEKASPLTPISSRSPTLNAPAQQRVIPLCSSCTTSMPTFNSLLDNARIQQSLFAFNDAMADINWSVPHAAAAGYADHGSESKLDGDMQLRPETCSLCAAKRAIPILTGLLMEVKAMKKEKGVSKADKKAVKKELKEQGWEIKKSFRKEWKEAKREARC